MTLPLRTADAGVVIRRASPRDLDAIAGIEDRSFTQDRFARRNLGRLLKSKAALFLLAEVDGRPAAYLMLLFRRGAKVARLYSLAVDPERRGLGLALSLIDAAGRESAERGAGRLRLELRPSNAPAMRLYQRAGFTFFERKAGYYADGEDAIRMDLVLSPAVHAPGGDQSL